MHLISALLLSKPRCLDSRNIALGAPLNVRVTGLSSLVDMLTHLEVVRSLVRPTAPETELLMSFLTCLTVLCSVGTVGRHEILHEIGADWKSSWCVTLQNCLYLSLFLNVKGWLINVTDSSLAAAGVLECSEVEA